MIINKPGNMHEQRIEAPEPKLPAVRGWFKKEEMYAPVYADDVKKVRTVTFVPGVKVFGFLLLLVGGCLAVKPADGVSPAQLQPGAVSMAILGLAILLWKREERHDAIYQNFHRMES